MFWESYRWEQCDRGDIYLQIFPNGKMYAGQTINIKNRLKPYKRNQGSNSHHTNALKKYDWSNVKLLSISCPKYLLDMVENYLIAFYHLTNKEIGYNKTTGGSMGYCHNSSTKLKISMSKIGITHTVEARANMSMSRKGIKNGFFGKKHKNDTIEKWSLTKSGENNPMFNRKHTPESLTKISNAHKNKCVSLETRAKLSVANIGKKHTLESLVKMSTSKIGILNSSAKPICVFGKLYPAAVIASDILRKEYKTKNKGNFVKELTKTKKHRYTVFYVSKKFYDYALKEDLDTITFQMYENYCNITL